MKIVDTRGEKCPKPIIETKKALKETDPGEIFAVLTDSKTSFNNISRFLNDNRIRFSVSESGGVWTIKVNNETGAADTTPAENYCENGIHGIPPGDYVIAITSEFLGSGDDELGNILMKSFFVSLTCQERLPSAIVLYNSGIKLAKKDSIVCEYLTEIENKGVELILCGTCVDYFGLRDNICAGKIGDMYQILEKLTSAGKIIRP